LKTGDDHNRKSRLDLKQSENSCGWPLRPRSGAAHRDLSPGTMSTDASIAPAVAQTLAVIEQANTVAAETEYLLLEQPVNGSKSAFEEACARADAEARRRRNCADKDSEPDEVARLAKLSRLEYDRQREDAATLLGVRVATLDKVVRDKRASADDDATTMPHWQVEPWPVPVDGARLLAALRQALRRYIVLPKGADIALALWVLHTWTFDAGEISPFLVLVSPTRRCGKTNTLIALHYLTPRSVLASNITGSALFRYIELALPTLLIDEADSFVKENEELRGILNSGHTKTAAFVIRNVEISGEHKPRRFSTWAPKAIATIGSRHA
jgi:hypothetical protein